MVYTNRVIYIYIVSLSIVQMLMRIVYLLRGNQTMNHFKITFIHTLYMPVRRTQVYYIQARKKEQSDIPKRESDKFYKNSHAYFHYQDNDSRIPSRSSAAPAYIQPAAVCIY